MDFQTFAGGSGLRRRAAIRARFDESWNARFLQGGEIGKALSRLQSMIEQRARYSRADSIGTVSPLRTLTRTELDSAIGQKGKLDGVFGHHHFRNDRSRRVLD